MDRSWSGIVALPSSPLSRHLRRVKRVLSELHLVSREVLTQTKWVISLSELHLVFRWVSLEPNG
jgi:hypothetical protein